MRKLVFYLLIICQLTYSQQVKVVNQPDTPTVLSELLLDYDVSVRPQNVYGGPTEINLTIHYGYVGLRNNELTLTLFLRQYWYDERFHFPKPINIKVKSSRLTDRIWVPDTFSPEATEWQALHEGQIQITNDGRVKWSRMLKMKTLCPFDMTAAYLTKGRQNCSFSFSSYGYRSDEIVYGLGEKCSTGGPEQIDPKSKVLDTKCEERTIHLSVGNFSKAFIEIEIQTPFNDEILKAILSRGIEARYT